MPLYAHIGRVYEPGTPGDQDPLTGRPASAADAGTPEALLYEGPCLVDDQASTEELDRYGTGDAGGEAIVYWLEEMETTKATPGRIFEYEDAGLTLRGHIAGARLTFSISTVRWESTIEIPA